jgi:hypothetical protein
MQIFGLLIRGSQVRILPGALRKVVVLQVKDESVERAKLAPDPLYTNGYTNAVCSGASADLRPRPPSKYAAVSGGSAGQGGS